jgi:hypothetical protein
MLKTLKLLLDLRSMWKSKTVTFGRLLALLPAFDLAFFQGDAGLKIVEFVTGLVQKVPGLMEVSASQVMSFLVVVIGGLVIDLRKRTSVPIETKL